MSDYDFSGYVTRNNVTCSDGRIIRDGAFNNCNGMRVPLVYQHDHMSPLNILGHCDLECRPDGVYGYAKCNSTNEGLHTLESVKNGDVDSFSIYANKLKQNGNNVIHGAIREVSVVLAGANPLAKIDTILAHDYDDEEEAEISGFGTVALYHSDDEEEDEDEKDPKKNDKVKSKKTSDEEEESESDEEEESESDEDSEDEKKDDMARNLKHADEGGSEKTVQDVIDSMSEEQKNVLYALVGMAAQGEGADEDEEEDDDMKHNAFDNDDVIEHADFTEVIRDMKRYGSLKESALQHGMLEDADALMHADGDYGIQNIDYLFPDYQNVTNTPQFVSREMTWVPKVMAAVSHTPFSRIKSIFANITEDEARAKGYIKGNQKKEEIFPLMKRTTDPQTVYKKQKLDRDDIVDITDFDVVVWLKAEMRQMLDEEVARAILVGDGRSAGDEDKVSADHIRPIWGDDPFYTIRAYVEVDAAAEEDIKYKNLIRAAIKARKDYKGSGNPTFYTTEDNLTGMLLLTDSIGRDLYESPEQLAKKLRVKEIVTVPVMENLTRTADSKDGTLSGKTMTFEGVITNLADYNVGADKGGAVSMFDDFDIDYNQQKYLIETRCSGAQIKPYCSIALETYPKA
jgi:HK97 family phage prohead protease